MNQVFQGWEAVAELLLQRAASQEQLALNKGEAATRLNPGQRASLRAMASRIPRNGVVIADEVGMGKTRIAVELARCVIQSGGRVAILVPPGLGYQWQSELREGEVLDVPNILRSLSSYLGAWAGDPQPWFAKQTVMVSTRLQTGGFLPKPQFGDGHWCRNSTRVGANCLTDGFHAAITAMRPWLMGGYAPMSP